MLSNDVKELHERGVLEDEDLEKLAQIEADLIAAVTEGGGSVLEVITGHLKKEGFDQGDYDKAARYLDSLGIDDEEKTAKVRLPKGVLGDLARMAGPLLGTGMLLALGGEKLYAHVAGKKALSGSLTAIKKQHPELRRDPMTDQHFQAISDFAPSIAKNQVVAGNLLLKMKQWGAIDHKTVQDLISMEESLAKARPQSPTVADTVRTMASFQSMIADVPLIGKEVKM